MTTFWHPWHFGADSGSINERDYFPVQILAVIVMKCLLCAEKLAKLLHGI